MTFHSPLWVPGRNCPEALEICDGLTLPNDLTWLQGFADRPQPSRGTPQDAVGGCRGRGTSCRRKYFSKIGRNRIVAVVSFMRMANKPDGRGYFSRHPAGIPKEFGSEHLTSHLTSQRGGGSVM